MEVIGENASEICQGVGIDYVYFFGHDFKSTRNRMKNKQRLKRFHHSKGNNQKSEEII